MINYILHNPLAGHGSDDTHLNSLIGLLDGEVITTDITSISDFADFFNKIPSDAKVILSGGDGTLNKFVNLVDTHNLSREIYYYASGSGNDFLHDIAENDEKYPIKINKYLKNLPSVTVNGKTYRFVNGVGYGIDGYCCEVGDAERAKSKKPVNYTAIAIKGLLFNYKPTNATVTVDGKEYRYNKVWIAPTMNGRFYGGGMMPAPNQDRLNPDGKLSVMIFHDTGKLKTLMIFPSLFKGEHVKHTDVVAVHEGKEITVKFDRPAPLQIDGETIIGVSEYTARAGALVGIN